MTSIAKAKLIIKTIFQASKSSNPSECFGRKFDSLFEESDSKEIVVEFMKNYVDDTELQKAVDDVNHWIGIENWKKTFQDWETKNPTLF